MSDIDVNNITNSVPSESSVSVISYLVNSVSSHLAVLSEHLSTLHGKYYIIPFVLSQLFSIISCIIPPSMFRFFILYSTSLFVLVFRPLHYLYSFIPQTVSNRLLLLVTVLFTVLVYYILPLIKGN